MEVSNNYPCGNIAFWREAEYHDLLNAYDRDDSSYVTDLIQVIQSQGKLLLPTSIFFLNRISSIEELLLQAYSFGRKNIVSWLLNNQQFSQIKMEEAVIDLINSHRYDKWEGILNAVFVNDDLAMAKVILNTNIRLNSMSMACHSNSLSIAKYLLNHKKDEIQMQGFWFTIERTLLQLASKGHFDMIFLITESKGISLDYQDDHLSALSSGVTILQIASAWGYSVEALLKKGANLDLKTTKNFYLYAEKWHNHNWKQIIIPKGLNCREFTKICQHELVFNILKKRVTHNTSYSWFSTISSEFSIENSLLNEKSISELISLLTNCNREISEGNTLLHYLMLERYTRASYSTYVLSLDIWLLIQKGADPTRMNKQGQDCFQIVAEYYSQLGNKSEFADAACRLDFIKEKCCKLYTHQFFHLKEICTIGTLPKEFVQIIFDHCFANPRELFSRSCLTCGNHDYFEDMISLDEWQ